jgi:tight adherence protein C
MSLAIGLALLVVLATVILLAGIAMQVLRPDPVHERLAQFADRQRSLEEMELEQSFNDRVVRPMIQRLSNMMERTNQRKDPRQVQREASAMQTRLNLAGNPNGWTPSDFLGVKALWAIILGAVVFVVSLVVSVSPMALLFGAGGALVGFFLPELYLGQKIRRRQHDIQRSLPDAMDLLVICVEAGLGFDGALLRLVQKTDNDLSHEFARVLQEMRVGRSRREALRDCITRTQVPDLANFIAALIQAESLGVSVTQVLSVQADQMRTIRRQRAQELAQQAPIKMLIPMLLFIFPALCVVLIGPLWPQIAASSLSTVNAGT